ncbi:MAG: tyrosine/phenylalanine carboxypeptidase domain-containing protein [Candidatus Altimarinota bacterium]
MLFKKSGILGINARNLLYLRPYNKEKSIKLADNKLKTKAFLSARGIPVPKHYAIISDARQIENIKFSKLTNGFVIKPNQGYGGQGILPIFKVHKNQFLGSGEKTYTVDNLSDHIKEILTGAFSLNNRRDTAFLEQLIISDESLAKYSYKGLPDIRIIVHNLIPVMAMLRIPTKESGGKANLHQGAIGAGIDLAKGQITHLIYKNEIIKEIPGYGPVRGEKIPFWDQILEMACKCQLATNLGYLGADIAIDKNLGPLLLEINARAGIGIQLANLKPLRSRLDKIEDVQVSNVNKGIRIAKDMFGYALEKEIKTVSGKKVIGLYENIDLFHNNAKTSATALINTAKKRSYISKELAFKLGLIDSLKTKLSPELKFKLKFTLGGKKLVSIFKIFPIKKKRYQAVIGNRDLSEFFLIDPRINRSESITENSPSSPNLVFSSTYNPREIDKEICHINSQLRLLSHFRPRNLSEEIKKFNADNTYNPQFIYKDSHEEITQLKKELLKIKPQDDVLGQLFNEKIQEIKLQMDLILSRGTNEFTNISSKLFGCPTQQDHLDIIDSKKAIIKKSNRRYTSLELKEMFEEMLRYYRLENWRVIIKKNLLSKCITNKSRKIFIKNDCLFSEDRVRALIIHEVETHLLTAENGLKQQYKLFNVGFANYLPTQEGLAIYNVCASDQTNSDDANSNSLADAIYLATQLSFADLYQALRTKKLTRHSALNIAIRVKRGLTDTSIPGALTKDYCYYSGKKIVQEFVKNGGDLSELYLGKFSIKDLPLIKQIADPIIPPILPKWFNK